MKPGVDVDRSGGGGGGAGNPADGAGLARSRAIAVGGRRYSVRSDATDEQLSALVEEVERRARAASGGRGVTSEGIVLAALVLAAEAQEQAIRADRMARFAGEALRELLVRVEEALGDYEREAEGDVGGELDRGGDLQGDEELDAGSESGWVGLRVVEPPSDDAT